MTLCSHKPILDAFFSCYCPCSHPLIKRCAQREELFREPSDQLQFNSRDPERTRLNPGPSCSKGQCQGNSDCWLSASREIQSVLIWLHLHWLKTPKQNITTCQRDNMCCESEEEELPSSYWHLMRTWNYKVNSGHDIIQRVAVMQASNMSDHLQRWLAEAFTEENKTTRMSVKVLLLPGHLVGQQVEFGQLDGSCDVEDETSLGVKHGGSWRSNTLIGHDPWPPGQGGHPFGWMVSRQSSKPTQVFCVHATICFFSR